MSNNLGLANFIVSFGSMNNYSSSVLQTKRALDLHNYLTLPFDDIDHAELMLGLMRFYRAHTKEQEEQVLNRMVAVLPSPNEVEYHLSRSFEQKDVDINDLKTKRVKSFYKNNFDNKND